MARPSRAHNSRNVLILTGVGHFSIHFFDLMFPTLAVALALQARLPLAEVLGWSFAAYALFGLGALPAGWLGARLGARLLLIVGLFGLGVASLAASEAPNARVLSYSLAAMGACASIYHPVSRILIARTAIAPARAGRINAVFGNAAIALTPLIVAALCERVGWQASYRLVGYGMCALAVACAFLRIDEDPVEPPPPPPVAEPMRRARLPLALVLAAATLAGIIYRGGTMIVPGYLAAHVTQIGFGAAASLVCLVGVAGRYVGGWLSRRHDQRRLYFACSAMALPALLLMSALTGLSSIASSAAFAFCAFGVQPIENRLFIRYLPARRGAVLGRNAALTTGVGALGVWLVQWADAAGGPSFALLCLAGVAALVLAAAALLLSIDGPSSDASSLDAPHWPALARPAKTPLT